MSFLAFVAGVIAIIMVRRLRGRTDDLEQRISEQSGQISSLTMQVARLNREREERMAPPPATAPPPKQAPVVSVPVARPPEIVPPPILPAPTPPPPPPPPPPPRPVAPPIAATPPKPAVPPPIVAPPIEPEPEAPSTPRFSIDWEQFVGVKLFSAIAGIALVFAGVFFLRYSIDHGWLQPPVRVVIGMLVAISLLVVCDRKAARQYPLLANAMDAAAIAILFATFFAAHSLWNLIPATAAFGLLALVTVTAVLLSIRHESLFIAVLGLLGGFATPLLLSTGENQPIPLFAYLLLLNIGLAWVAYRKGWTILSVLTMVFTTIYQFGWVARFLDSGQVPLAIGIFSLFPVTSYAMLSVARSRSSMREHAAAGAFGWSTLASAVVPAIFAVYLASVPQFRDHYVMLFGWLLLIDAGLLAVAIAQSREELHAIGGGVTLLVFLVWMFNSYVPGSFFVVMGFAAAFVALYLAASRIAARFGDEFDGAGLAAILTAPALLFVFPLLVSGEPRASSTLVVFPALFALVSIITWRSLAEQRGALYFIAAFFALATEAAWSAKYLNAETLRQGVMTYLAFAALYLGVPLYARRRGEPLEPAYGGGVVLLAGLAMLLFLSIGPIAATGLWGLALLLAILNAALFIESAAASIPALSIAGSIASWFILAIWWSEAAAAVGILSSLLVLVGLALVMAFGHIWALGQTRADEGAQKRFGWGLWLSLVVHLFLIGVAIEPRWAVPPWPLFGALGVVVMAFSTVALAASRPAMHFASTVMAAIILALWADASQAQGFAPTALAAYGVLSVFALAWLPLLKRFDGHTPAVLAPAGTAATVIAVVEFFTGAMNSSPLPAPFATTLAAHASGFIVLLILAARYQWKWSATFFAVLAGNASAQMLLRHGITGSEILVQTSVIYAVFAAYPLLLGSRARESRDPYVAALVAGAWCFFIARQGMEASHLGWMVGVVPVILGAITTIHLRQLLRIQPSGSRDLGRLALVAGGALAFLTVAIPVQVSHQWITIGWALEGAAVAWLYTRIPHRGLFWTSVGLLGVVFVRLAVNPEVFHYEPRGDMRIINWYLYAYATTAAAMFVAAWWLSKTNDVILNQLPRMRHLLPAAATILLFLLLNIEIADYYSDGPEILFRFGSSVQQDLTYTIGWLIFGILMLAAGIIAKARAARMASVAMIAVTTFKAFLYDLRSLEGLYRVGAFVGLAISLALVSLALQKYVLATEKEAAR